MIDWSLIISIIINIIMLILAYKFKKQHWITAKKLLAVYKLVQDFIKAYEDKVITKEEAEKLIKDVEAIIRDP